MDESANKATGSKGSDEAVGENRIIISVSGYDNGLPHDEIESSLRSIFSSCGEITDVYIYRKARSGTLSSNALLYICGEGAKKKSFQLHGTDVGGWKAHVEAVPIRNPYFHPERGLKIRVFGYDTKLSEPLLESKLRDYLSPCGEITDVRFGVMCASAYIRGEGVEEKVLELPVCEEWGFSVAREPKRDLSRHRRIRYSRD
ncbi:hypothetical protein Bca52824_004188 [Brassica carinata]|uniref:RRM domain-containing protein n=1 Tax=Brassica carinata TaxID=52824 RepID=A0A8X8BFX1_BRACI|nr:hypothetical protein Bca52824_004188 [Brassica carinata]